MKVLKVKTIRHTQPALNQPFFSESFDVVRLSDYLALLGEVELAHKRCKVNKDNTTPKVHGKRFRHPRFKAAFNYWAGVLSTYDFMEWQLNEIIKTARDEK